ncbi:flagellar protein FlaG [Derxia gummosa]|uniref:Flagellar protein FlaG n=1 Tax=Derxia gummosa DSM 723 TaxID=1121388 RepID=A0A8B6XA69_9BURK|nr:flagellar protein FlaG [Derxia gummosa]
MIRVANDSSSTATLELATTGQKTAATARAQRGEDASSTAASAKAEATEKAKAAKEAKPEDVKDAVKKLNQSLEDDNRQVRFEIDPSSSRVITKIVDTSTKEVLRQIPSEEVLRMAEALKGKDTSSSSSSSDIPLVRTRA